jgi:hypothetical protein
LNDKSFITPGQTAQRGQPEVVPETMNAGGSAALNTIRIPAHPQVVISFDFFNRIDPMRRADAVEKRKEMKKKCNCEE